MHKGKVLVDHTILTEILKIESIDFTLACRKKQKPDYTNVQYLDSYVPKSSSETFPRPLKSLQQAEYLKLS